MTNPKDDPTSIGAILIATGVITADQLVGAVEEQERASIEILLGKLLVANGVISSAHLESALKVQKELRCKDKRRRALAQAEIAEQSTGAVIAMSTRLRQKSKEVKEGVVTSGTEFPRVTDAMLAKKSE